MSDLERLGRLLLGEHTLSPQSLTMMFGQYCIRVRSNSSAHIDQLRDYFSHVPMDETASPDIEILAIEREPVDLPVEFIDWKREPGKTGRKDSYHDVPGGRLVRKVRTGMVFLQSADKLIAAGPCQQFDNQVINYINSQYMNWLQNRGWLICHASGLVHNDHCMAMAGLSGGGKSTLMLRLLEQPVMQYMTNDRLFIRLEGDQVMATGIPKLPRINPGTIVHNPRLHPLIPSQRREQLLAMPADELWHLEEKHDVHIEQLYGNDRIRPEAELRSLLILNWQHDSDSPTTIQQVDLDQRHDLLAAVMKSPGPFYQRADLSFLMDDEILSDKPYLDILERINTYEITGNVDFDKAASMLQPIMANHGTH